MTTLEYGNKLAWPCHVACWLPIPRTKSEKLNTLATAASKAPAPGNWLTSSSKKGEIVTIGILQDAPPLLKILCEGGGCLVSSPLTSNIFSFALVREVMLVASLIDPSKSSTYTFSCRFMCHQHAVECAAVMKAAISAPLTLFQPTARLNKQQPSQPAGGPSVQQQRAAELLLLDTIVGGNIESAGCAWWQDFPQLVEEIDQQWTRKNQQQKQLQQFF